MKIGVFGTFMSPTATPEMVGDFAKRAEQAGVHTLWMGEHVVLFDEMEFPYPASKDGRIPTPPGGGLLDTVATFGYLAAETTSLRFGTGIALISQRNPVYTANEFATLDWLTKGRMDFGVGVGWCKEEVIASGYRWDDRGARADEFLQLVKSFWTDPVTNFDGDHFQVHAARMDPKPVQKPHVPIIVGGHSKAGLRRAARFGNGWYGFNMDLEGTKEILAQLDGALAAEGRSRDGFEIVITPTMNFTDDMISAFSDLGVDQLALQLGSQKPDKIDRRLIELEATANRAA